MDPWLIAADALSELRKVQWSSQARDHLMIVKEALRRLACGPDD
jgi:hypothetical protein